VTVRACGGTLGRHEPRGSGNRRRSPRVPDKPGDLSPTCCPYYHEAVELIGRRWTGAIVAVLLDGGPLRFSEISHAVPELSDRLLSSG
jgi:DNA-binding HxlR family transcriptional regulator